MGDFCFGGVEAGGTKWVCAVGSGPNDLRATVAFPTSSPEETIEQAVDFFIAHGPIVALGIGSFGPIDLRPDSPHWGTITTTPKPGWAFVAVAPALQSALKVPTAFDTDVNVAALGEERWGAARGLSAFLYFTVGTGIGAGGMIGGELIHGRLHPEMGHMFVPHDRCRDPFAGACPYHGDCLEGLASGEAMRQRAGWSGDVEWDRHHKALEAEYLALGLLNAIAAYSPERIILGGGVMKQPGLLRAVRKQVGERAAGYFGMSELGDELEHFIVAPQLGALAGVIGALALARALHG